MRQPTEVCGAGPGRPRGRAADDPGRVPCRVEWGVPARAAQLPAGEVHIALTRIERPEWPADELEELLSADERARAAKFRFVADRRRYVVGRGMLRLWLSRYLQRPPQALEFRYGPNGKPFVTESAGLHFNLSHAGGLAAYAATRVGEIGIDLERRHEFTGWEQIGATCFAPEERARIADRPPEEQLTEFFRLWTRHEAWLKAWGAGLGGPGAQPGEDGWSRPGATGALETFAPAPGYIASVAVIFSREPSSEDCGFRCGPLG